MGKPITHTHRDSPKRKNATVTIVPILLGIGSPITIIRRVALIVISSFYSQAQRGYRTRPHVLIKLLKRMSPLFTNSNSSTSVTLKFLVVWIRASLNHACPDTIFRHGSVGVLRHPMCCNRFTPETSARPSMSTLSLVCLHFNCVSAIAEAFPPTKLPTTFARLKELALYHETAMPLSNMRLSQRFRWFGKFSFAHALIIPQIGRL